VRIIRKNVLRSFSYRKVNHGFLAASSVVRRVGGILTSKIFSQPDKNSETSLPFKRIVHRSGINRKSLAVFLCLELLLLVPFKNLLHTFVERKKI
jgi:hypothetical protein